MWQLHQKATRFHKPPSELIGIEDAWTAYQFDNAVNYFGITIENALAETHKVGIGPNAKTEPRYTLETLLDPAFRLPRAGASAQGPEGAPGFDGSGMAALLALAETGPRSGIKKWVYIGPTPDPKGQAA